MVKIEVEEMGGEMTNQKAALDEFGLEECFLEIWTKKIFKVNIHKEVIYNFVRSVQYINSYPRHILAKLPRVYHYECVITLLKSIAGKILCSVPPYNRFIFCFIATFDLSNNEKNFL